MEYRPLAEAEESELIRMAQDRDPEAFSELMRRNSSASFRLALSVLKDRQEAEDEVQTSFLKAWTHLPTFHSESRFSTWFRTIVLNQSLMRLRKARKGKFQSLEQPEGEGPVWEPMESSPGPEASVGGNQLQQMLRVEVQRLPPLLREVLVLRDLQELTTEEASERLGISESATKSRLSRARDMLKQRMSHHGPNKSNPTR